MKRLFWLLLLFNLVLFGFMQWGEILTGEGKNMPNRPPLNAEKIKLLEVSPAARATVPPPFRRAVRHAGASGKRRCLPGVEGIFRCRPRARQCCSRGIESGQQTGAAAG